MEWNILFMGPVGAGKTKAIRSISDIEVVNTDEEATDETRFLKQNTTVSMDVGTLKLDGVDKLRLLGSPGQDRFDFMWDILIEQAKGIILVLDHSRPNPLSDLDHFITAIEDRLQSRSLPIVICVTHMDSVSSRSLQSYENYLQQRIFRCIDMLPPVVEMDARDPLQVRVVLIVMTALLEMCERFPKVATNVTGDKVSRPEFLH